MSGDGRTRVPTFSERAYRALLFAYPRGFRREYGQEMACAFADLCEEERERRGTIGLLLLWARALLDLFANALAERGGSLVDGSSSGSVRWGARGRRRRPARRRLRVGLPGLRVGVSYRGQQRGGRASGGRGVRTGLRLPRGVAALIRGGSWASGGWSSAGERLVSRQPGGAAASAAPGGAPDESGA